MQTCRDCRRSPLPHLHREGICLHRDWAECVACLAESALAEQRTEDEVAHAVVASSLRLGCAWGVYRIVPVPSSAPLGRLGRENPLRHTNVRGRALLGSVQVAAQLTGRLRRLLEDGTEAVCVYGTPSGMILPMGVTSVASTVTPSESAQAWFKATVSELSVPRGMR